MVSLVHERGLHKEDKAVLASLQQLQGLARHLRKSWLGGGLLPVIMVGGAGQYSAVKDITRKDLIIEDHKPQIHQSVDTTFFN